MSKNDKKKGQKKLHNKFISALLSDNLKDAKKYYEEGADSPLLYSLPLMRNI